MIDPNFFEDDDYSSDWYEHEEEECIFDTFDQVVDNLEFDPEMQEPDGELDATSMGMALALAEAINDANDKKWDMDDNTDRENLEKVQALSSRYASVNGKPLRPFEEYINDICTGQRSIFDYD